MSKEFLEVKTFADAVAKLDTLGADVVDYMDVDGDLIADPDSIPNEAEVRSFRNISGGIYEVVVRV